MYDGPAMSRAAVTCPRCAQRCSVDTDARGADAHCSRCGCDFRPDLTMATVVQDRRATAPTPGPLFAPEPEWPTGHSILGLYQVTALLGRGGMGEVYKVRHRGWGVDLAVKRPRNAIVSDTEGRANVVREAETWINLGLHPHTVACYYVRTIENIPCVFAEYVDGGSLSEWIKTHRLYRDGAALRVLDIAIQIAWGLHHAHESGLVHQDVKPSNIMLTPDGTAKVTDFGMAKARGRMGMSMPGESSLASVGGMTPAYCSPEQAAAMDVSRRTDVWSWAVSVLEMYVGQVVWELGPDAGGALRAYRVSGGPNPTLPRMPDDVGALLAQCFATDPDGRPRTMLDLVAVLRAAYQRIAGAPYPRPEPRAGPMLADALNNRAVSLLDLDRADEAEKLWQQALASDPHHLHATYNQGLFLWRAGKLTDDALVRRLREAISSHARNPDGHLMLGLVHEERGDLNAAREPLERAKAVAQEPLRPGYACRMTIAGHAAPVTAVALAPRVVVSASRDRTLRVSDSASGLFMRALEGHKDAVTCVALTPDGRLAVSGGSDRTVRLWTVSNGRCLKTLEGHGNVVSAVALSPDGRRALSASWDRTVRVWDVDAGKCARVLQEHRDSVDALAFASFDLAVSAGADGVLRIWNLSTGTSTTIECRAHALAITDDGRLALSADADHVIRAWDLASARCVQKLAGHGERAHALAMTPDGRFALSAGRDRTVRVWNVASGRCLRTLDVEAAAVAISPDGRTAATGGADVRLWEIPDDAPAAPMLVVRPRRTEEVAAGGDKLTELLDRTRSAMARKNWRQAVTLVCSARAMPGYERSPQALAVWREVALRTGRSGLRDAWAGAALEANAHAVALSEDGALAVSGGLDGGARVWELEPARCARTLEGHAGPIQAVALSADGRFAVTSGADRTVRAWEVATGRPLWTRSGEGVCITPDGRIALSAEQLVRVWDAASGKLLKDVAVPGPVLAVSPDGRVALAGAPPRVIDLAAGAAGATLGAHRDAVLCAAVSSDSRTGATGGEDGDIRLWNLATGGCARILAGHKGAVTGVHVSGDGRFVLSASRDATLRLWNASTGECVRTMEGHGSDLTGVALAADLRTAVSASRDRTVRVWHFDWQVVARDPLMWDEAALPWADAFLRERVPIGPDGLSRRGAPAWTEEQFQSFLRRLEGAGFGWLRPEGVKARLAELGKTAISH